MSTDTSDAADSRPSYVPPYRDEEWLYEMFYVRGLPCAEMAKKAGCAPTTISTYLNDLPPEKEIVQPHHDEEWLYEQYYVRGLPQHELARKAGVSGGSVSYRIDRLPPEKEIRRPHHDEGWLRKMHHEYNLSQVEMARKAGVDPSSITTALRKHGIARYDHRMGQSPESRRRRRGPFRDGQGGGT